MVICECGADLKSITQKHLNSAGHLNKLNKKKGNIESPSKVTSTKTSSPSTPDLEKRVATLEGQMNTVLDELVTLQRSIQNLFNTKPINSDSLNVSEILTEIGKSGGMNNWVAIDLVYGPFKDKNIPFSTFQTKVIELADRNKIELGDGRSTFKIKNRGFEFGLVRMV